MGYSEKMKKDILENRQIRIFLSSTFRDMQAERTYLVTRVFPALRRYCEERDVSIFELDLRWGISEEEAKQGKVFDICLKEVRKTKPFFIGLLGERYGWAPTEEERKSMAENTTVFKDFPWVADELAKGASITEIEFQEGVLRSTEKMEAYFYLRSPRMETPAEFREDADSHEGIKLRELKKALREQNVYPVKEYDSIEQLGALVEKDFKALVDELFPEGALSPLEKERHEQHIFLVNKTRVYVPNPAREARLDEFVDGTESAIVISGESGMGKSALIADWVNKRLQKKKENEKIIYHFIGASQSEGDYRKITKRLINEIRDIYGIPAPEEEARQIAAGPETKNQTDKQTEELQNLVFSIAGNEKLIIALDGIDRLDNTDNAKLLNWLPSPSQNVKFIFSATPDDTSMEAFTRWGCQRLDIGALPVDLIERLVNDYLKSFSKSLTPAQVERIAADKESENPLALLAVLDELRVSGVHETLDRQIDEFLSAPDLESLFALILQHTEELFSDGSAGKNLVQDILSLIAVSRQGLSETEILELSGAAPLYWSQLANSMAGHLSTINGLVSFSNRLMRNAARKRYLPNAVSEQPYRGRIVSYMETNEQVSFERKCDELPYQLSELREWEKLYNFILNYRVFQYIYKKDENEIGAYWRVLREQDGGHYTPENYIKLDERTVEDKDLLLDFYENLGFMIRDILGDYSLSLKFALFWKEICEGVYGENHLETARSYNDIGLCYTDMGDNQKALEYYNKSLVICEKLLGKNHPYTARNYSNIGVTYTYIGDYQTALEYLQKSLAIYEKLPDMNPLDTATSYNNIGGCYDNMGDKQRALEYHQKSLAIREKLLGINHPDTASCYKNIGSCYSDLGDNQKALEYHLKCLAINEKLLGMNHPDTAVNYNDIGLCYKILGDYRKAIEYYHKCVAIEEKLLGINHPNTALSYNIIGICYSNLGDNQNALEYHLKCLAIREELLGEIHPDTAMSYNNIGLCYKDLGDYRKALEYFHKSLALLERFLGATHPGTALSYNNVGTCYYNLYDFRKALEYHQKCLVIREKFLGETHPDTAASYNNIVLCYFNMGDYRKALEYYLKCLAIRENLQGKKHPDTATCYNGIGLCYFNLGDYRMALTYHHKCLAIREKLLGKNHPDTATSYNNIGLCYRDMGKYRKALKYCNKCLAIDEKLLGKNHPNTAIIYINTGSVYYKARNYQKALGFHLEAMEIRKKIYGETHPETAFSFNKVAMDYEALGNNEKANEYYYQALSIYSFIKGKEKDAENVRRSLEKLTNR
jgi:tetratricopeptide (TPR) repeat protein